MLDLEKVYDFFYDLEKQGCNVENLTDDDLALLKNKLPNELLNLCDKLRSCGKELTFKNIELLIKEYIEESS